jgi:hypothetical protein
LVSFLRVLCAFVVKDLWDAHFSDFFATLLLCGFALKNISGTHHNKQPADIPTNSLGRAFKRATGFLFLCVLCASVMKKISGTRSQNRER